MMNAESRKVGILGGTFDPPHAGHLGMARAAYEKAGLDEILFIPTGTPRYKLMRHPVSEKEHRLNMVRLMIQGLPWCSLSTLECDREGNTYTADTVAELTGENPDVSYDLIVGSDSLKNMGRWYEPQRVFSRVGILVLPRGGDTPESLRAVIREYTDKYHARIRVVDAKIWNVSSTRVRELAAEGKLPEGYVPKRVEEYIYRHRLYEKKAGSEEEG